MDHSFGETTTEDETHEEIPDGIKYDLDEDDLYAALNVSRTATSDEITAAYRRLSRIYHPDKHLNNKEIAENLFSKIKKAHEVLSDASTRAIYDTLGLTGLENEGNELVERYQTPQEIREAYERLRKEKEEREMERKTNPKGSMTVNINATEIFSPYVPDDEDPFYADAGVPYVELTGFNFSQSIEAPLTPRETIIMSGSVSSQNGRGSGNISCALRKTLSNKSWGEFEFGGSSAGLDFGLKGFSQFTRKFFGNFNLVCQSSNGILRPGALFALGSQLDQHTVGTLTYRTGNSNSLAAGVVRDTGTNRIALSFHLGIPHIYGMVQTSHKREDVKFRLNFKGGTFGAFLEYGIEKKITKFTTVGALMIVGVPHGVLLRLKIMRANQSYIFPIQLADELIPAPIIYGTIVPLVAYLAVKKLFIEPYEKEREGEEKRKKQMAYKNKLNEKRAEAEGAITLMRITYDRSREEEASRDGLIILNALYGHLTHDATSSNNTQNPPLNNPSQFNTSEIGYVNGMGMGDEVINVTIPLQCLVRDSTLIVSRGSKVNLPGFYDPAPGERKGVYIRYLFKKEEHEVVVGEEEDIKIPKKSHRISQVAPGGGES